ncbi:MAG: peptidoglycan editing factor PgeF [Betaproteobacteria bacterium]|nr:peptidoglycan editing factor PgeF [Betaproteobacteria bacterium]
MRALAETIAPDWPAPRGVHGFVSTRALGNVKDAAVRAKLRALLPAAPVWLTQVHGTHVLDAAAVGGADGEDGGTGRTAAPEADASITRTAGVVCCVMAADCMPVLLAARDGSVVGAAHAGWRGLAAGVIERTIDAMRVPGEDLLAYLGPAIGPRAYEVGAEVRAAFVTRDAVAAQAFIPTRPGHWLLDLYALARQRLAAQGVVAVYGGTHCTVCEPERFFSFRRDKASERMAACIYLDPPGRHV